MAAARRPAAAAHRHALWREVSITTTLGPGPIRLPTRSRVRPRDHGGQRPPSTSPHSSKREMRSAHPSPSTSKTRRFPTAGAEHDFSVRQQVERVGRQLTGGASILPFTATGDGQPRVVERVILGRLSDPASEPATPALPRRPLPPVARLDAACESRRTPRPASGSHKPVVPPTPTPPEPGAISGCAVVRRTPSRSAATWGAGICACAGYVCTPCLHDEEARREARAPRRALYARPVPDAPPRHRAGRSWSV